MKQLGTQISKTRLIALIVALGCITFVLPVWRSSKARTGDVATQCRQIGRDLLAFTNSSSLSSIQPSVQKHLSQFLSAPARVEAVQLGDEPRPAGDFKADARLYFLNDRDERLGLRLQQETRSGKFRVLGYWTPTSPPPAEPR